MTWSSEASTVAYNKVVSEMFDINDIMNVKTQGECMEHKHNMAHEANSLITEYSTLESLHNFHSTKLYDILSFFKAR